MERKKKIDIEVPAGQVLRVGGLRFVGPTHAKAVVRHDAEEHLGPVAPRRVEKLRKIKVFDDLSESEKIAGLMTTLSQKQKAQIVVAMQPQRWEKKRTR